MLSPREVASLLRYLKDLDAVTVETHPALYREDMAILRALRSRLVSPSTATTVEKFQAAETDPAVLDHLRAIKASLAARPKSRRSRS